MRHVGWVVVLFGACVFPSLMAADLVAVEGCTLVPTDWADGDSFRVRTPEGEEHTVRLYGVDCVEQHVSGETDARRLRSQRRYFGITQVRGTAADSIAFAKEQAALATVATRALLEGRPFTIHTSFADGRGDGRFKRIYAFVFDAEGRDLATQLVSQGLARAYGVSRSTLAGESADDYREQLRDLELQAAKRGSGIWAFTDWEQLPLERRLERDEARDLQRAVDGGDLPPGTRIDPNTASRDDLMRLPGVGEALANRIIEGRPYAKPADLDRVSGIGAATLRELLPLLDFPPGSAKPQSR
jgi:competence protein ComEA